MLWFVVGGLVGGALLGALLVIGLARLRRPPRTLPRDTAFRDPAPRYPVPRKSARRDTGSPLDLWDVPGYETLEKVGTGGAASVYRARRRRDGKIVALKIPAEATLGVAEGLRREAELAGRLRHPNVVRTFEHGSVGAKPYLVMEFLDGCSLESFIDARPPELAVSRALMRQAVEALHHLHAAGVVHRDLKPANLMVLRGGVSSGSPPGSTLKLMDFSVAGGREEVPSKPPAGRVGTPAYMSPEGARGLETDARSDVYSLGLVFYELLTGQPAFRGGYEAIMHQQIFGLPLPLRQHNPSLHGALERLVMRMIAKAPEERPALGEIAAFLRDGPFETEAVELPCRLLFTVRARRGVVRILDTSGTLHAALGEVGAHEGALPAAPQACASDREGNLLVAADGPGADRRMIHKLGPDGAPLLAFGSYGLKPGEFLCPVALAVAPDETLYILDAETHLVQRVGARGEFLSSFGGRGAGRGLFDDPRDLRVDAGGVYVLDYGNRRVQHFDLDGSYRTHWTLPTPDDPTGLRRLTGFAPAEAGGVYLMDAWGGVYKLSAAGELLTSFEAQPPPDGALTDLGVDDAGYLFAALRGEQLVRKYHPDGQLSATFETYAPILQMRVHVKA